MRQFVLINTRTIRAVLQFCAYNTRRAGAREGGRGRARGARAEPLLHASHSGIIHRDRALDPLYRALRDCPGHPTSEKRDRSGSLRGPRRNEQIPHAFFPWLYLLALRSHARESKNTLLHESTKLRGAALSRTLRSSVRPRSFKTV